MLNKLRTIRNEKNNTIIGYYAINTVRSFLFEVIFVTGQQKQITVKGGLNLVVKRYSCLICGYKGLIQNPFLKESIKKRLTFVHVAVLNLTTVRIMM